MKVPLNARLRFVDASPPPRLSARTRSTFDPPDGIYDHQPMKRHPHEIACKAAAGLNI